MGNMITKQEFIQAVVNAVKMTSGIQAEAGIVDIRLNNGNGGCIQVQCGQNTYVNVYIEDYYQAFCNGDFSAVMAAAEAVVWMKEDSNAYVDVLKDMTQKWMDYEQARGRLMCRLVNTALNRDALDAMPSISFHDLSITFYLMADDTGKRIAGVNNSILDHWGVSIDDLYRDALANMQAKTPTARIESVFRTIEKKIADEEERNVIEELERAVKDAGAQPLYILTNRTEVLGAAVILCPGVLETCAKKMGGDYYLIPSSIHEFLLMPVGRSPEEICEMIRRINQTELKPEDVLSDHAYLYSAAEKRLVMV